MNNTITLSQLILRLAKVAGCDTTTSRRFLRSFFATVEEALIHGETVTVRGIGTFRPVAGIEPGAPVKVAFMPDAALAKEINAPFEMFEPVELADGVDFSEVDNKEAEPAAPVAVAAPEPASEPAPEPEPEPAPESEPVPAAATEPVVIREDIEETINIVHDPVPAPSAFEPEVAEEVAEVYPEAEAKAEVKPEGGNSKLWLIGGAIIVLGGLIGFLAALLATADDDSDTTPFIEESIETPAPADTVAIIEEVAVEDIAAANEPQAAAAPAVEPEPTPAAPAPAAKEPVYDTVSASNYLATMARKYYGKSGYWVFIYQANADKLSNPNRISPGTRVLIPELSSFAEPTEKETTRKAELLRQELNRKYGN